MSNLNKTPNNTEKIINIKTDKKSYYGNFVQKLLFSLTFFSLCFYLIIHDLNSSNIPLVITQTKIIFYFIQKLKQNLLMRSRQNFFIKQM